MNKGIFRVIMDYIIFENFISDVSFEIPIEILKELYPNFPFKDTIYRVYRYKNTLNVYDDNNVNDDSVVATEEILKILFFRIQNEYDSKIMFENDCLYTGINKHLD